MAVSDLRASIRGSARSVFSGVFRDGFHVNRSQIYLNGRHPQRFPFNAWTAGMHDADRSSSGDVIALPRPTKDDGMSARRERVDIFHELTQPSGSHSHEIVAPCELQADVNCGDPGYTRNHNPTSRIRSWKSGFYDFSGFVSS
jgi:hypothetical protein